MNYAEWKQALTQHGAAVAARIIKQKGDVGTNGTGRASNEGDNAIAANQERERMTTLFALLQVEKRIGVLLRVSEEEYDRCQTCDEEIQPRRIEVLLSQGINMKTLLALRICLKCAEKAEEQAAYRYRRSELVEKRAW